MTTSTPSTLASSQEGATPWPRVPLGEVCDFIRGVTFKKAQASYEVRDDHVPVLRAGNINEVLDLEHDLIWVPCALVSEDQYLRTGDVVVCMSSGSPKVVGKSAMVIGAWHGTAGAFVGIIRPRECVSATYLSHWLRSPAFAEWRDSQARGANIQNLRWSQLAHVEIPLPPLSEQRRIAARLEEQMAHVARARAGAEGQLATIDAMPAALLREAFKGAG